VVGPDAIITITVAQPDVAELLASLVAANVCFVVVGGVAAGAWGVPGHRKDVDVVLDPRPAHLARAAELVVRLAGYADHGGMRSRSPAAIATALRNSRRVLLSTDLGHLDVVNRVDGVPSYDTLRRDAVPLSVHGVRVQVCSLAHLQSMKRTADRESDRRDLEQLARATSYPGSASPARGGAG
jgi:predicted nucleotidyltransferase